MRYSRGNFATARRWPPSSASYGFRKVFGLSGSRITGTPFDGGGSTREQGIGKNGNPRVRRIMAQSMWRRLRFQPESALAKWFHERTGGAKGRMKKIMAIASARKLPVALWRHVETGAIPDGARFAAA